MCMCVVCSISRFTWVHSIRAKLCILPHLIIHWMARPFGQHEWPAFPSDTIGYWVTVFATMCTEQRLVDFPFICSSKRRVKEEEEGEKVKEESKRRRNEALPIAKCISVLLVLSLLHWTVAFFILPLLLSFRFVISCSFPFSLSFCLSKFLHWSSLSSFCFRRKKRHFFLLTFLFFFFSFFLFFALEKVMKSHSTPQVPNYCMIHHTSYSLVLCSFFSSSVFFFHSSFDLSNKRSVLSRSILFFLSFAVLFHSAATRL